MRDPALRKLSVGDDGCNLTGTWPSAPSATRNALAPVKHPSDILFAKTALLGTMERFPRFTNLARTGSGS